MVRRNEQGGPDGTSIVGKAIDCVASGEIKFVPENFGLIPTTNGWAIFRIGASVLTRKPNFALSLYQAALAANVQAIIAAGYQKQQIREQLTRHRVRLVQQRKAKLLATEAII